MTSHLTAITPVTKMAGRLDLLESWVTEALLLGIKVVIVHDFRDECTQIDLEQLVKRCGTQNLILISDRFGNPGAARNAGMENLNTEWVCFWDSDDLPNISNVMEELNSCDPSIDLVIGQYTIFHKTEKFDPPRTSATFTVEDFALNPGLWRILIRSKLVKEVSFPSLRMGEDQVFLNSLNVESLKVEFSTKVFYTYFTGESSQLTNNSAAITDLSSSIHTLSASLSQKSEKYFLVTGIMLLRMCTTAIIKGRIKLKFSSTLPLLRALRKMGPKVSLKVIRRIFGMG